MRAIGDTSGRFSVTVELVNDNDLIHSQLGGLDLQKVRRKTIRAIVDRKVMRMVIPKNLVKELGFAIHSAPLKTRRASGRWCFRAHAQGIRIGIHGRYGLLDAMVEPRATNVVVGWMALDVLDMVMNDAEGRLEKRDPRFVTCSLGW